MGWKEPNSHVFLDELTQFYPNMKYILLVRNGLDMAYSKNQNQLLNWGDSYGIDVSNLDEKTMPKASVKFWVKANQKAMDVGQSKLGERFLKINFEDLCKNPQIVIQQIVDFLNLPSEKVHMDKLITLPQTQKLWEGIKTLISQILTKRILK